MTDWFTESNESSRKKLVHRKGKKLRCKECGTHIATAVRDLKMYDRPQIADFNFVEGHSVSYGEVPRCPTCDYTYYYDWVRIAVI